MKTLKGVEAKNHFNELVSNYDVSGKYESLVDNSVTGGYWQENNGNWVAFDNWGNDATIESFLSEVEAVKYAEGKEAITKSGFTI